MLNMLDPLLLKCSQPESANIAKSFLFQV